MLRPLIAVSCVFAIAPALAAQEKPTPAAQQAMAAQWFFDQSRSDTVAGDPLQGVASHSAISGGAADASHTGGGSSVSSGGGGGGGGGGSKGKGGGGGGGGGGSVLPPPAPGAAPASGGLAGGGGRSRDPHLAVVLDDADPGAGMVIAVNDSIVSMVTANQLKAGGRSDWKTDGKKHQDAQMDGSIIEQQAMWSDGDLTTVKTVAGIGTLKREFKVSKDGKTLEVKEHIEVGSRKADKKLFFTRKE